MSATQLQKALELKRKQNPQMDYMWRIALPYLSRTGLDPTGQISSATVAAPSEAFDILMGKYPELDDTDQINHRVYSVDVPFQQFESKKNTQNSKFFYTTGHSDLGTISLRVDEMEDGLTLKYFTSWQKLIRNENPPFKGTYNLPFIYKRNIRLWKLSTSGAELHFSDYIGAIPTEISPTSHSFEGAGIVQYGITLTADAVRHTFVPISEVYARVQAEQASILNYEPFDRFVLNDDLMGAVGSLINKGIQFF